MLFGLPEVSKQPIVELRRWSVMRIDGGGERLDVLIGFDDRTDCGRCSSQVQSFDPERSSVVTKSGRSYQLIGPPGLDRDAEYVFEQKYGFLVLPEGSTAEEVTDEYWSQIQGVTQP